MTKKSEEFENYLSGCPKQVLYSFKSIINKVEFNIIYTFF